MKEYTQKLDIENSITLPKQSCPEDVLFFDIETTGFSPANTVLYLIGCIYYKDSSYYMTQWFADTVDSEKDLLSAFISFTQNYRTLIHYNGSGFDIPYINKKCHIYGIECDFSHLQSLDIYKEIQPVKTLLKTDNLKQKTIEKFLGINREDVYTGGELIEIYKNYLKKSDDAALRLLLLHNHDDIIGMTMILPILNYPALLNGSFTLQEIALNTVSSETFEKKEVIISLHTKFPLNTRTSYGKDDFYLTAYKNTLKLAVNIYTGELKYFYPNYKDYYYLPEEDYAIHKSVASYVDKNYRIKANAANCYSKKAGAFLPQPEEIITPSFKMEHSDKITYFEYNEAFNSDSAAVLKYVNHIIKYLAK